jgi:hypothetical protein
MVTAVNTYNIEIWLFCELGLFCYSKIIVIMLTHKIRIERVIRIALVSLFFIWQGSESHSTTEFSFTVRLRYFISYI